MKIRLRIESLFQEASTRDITALADWVRGNDVDISPYVIFEHLIQDGYDPVRLYRSLLILESYVLKQNKATSEEVRWEMVLLQTRVTMERFHLLRDALRMNLDTMMVSGHEPDTRKMTAEFRKDILHDTMERWRASQVVRLYNYYRGVCVQALVLVARLRPTTISCLSSQEMDRVLIAGRVPDRAYAQSAATGWRIGLKVVNVQGETVDLYVDTLSPVKPELRRNIRVDVRDEENRVTLSQDGIEMGDALLRDFSLTGLGLYPEKMDAEEKISPESTLGIHVRLGKKSLKLSGQVCWMVFDGKSSRARMGIRLMRDTNTQMILQKELFRVQRQIVGHLQTRCCTGFDVVIS